MWSQTIYGQPIALQVLTKAMQQHRLAHGYLFVGPEGVGKRLTALRLAQAINCERGEGQACGVCPSCHKHQTGVHLDLHLVEPQGQKISVDQIRALTKEMVRRPHEGRRRVAIVDPADRLTAESANALLKTLEEPAPESLYVLITSHLEAVLPTIRSRCQLVRFGPLPQAALEQLLADHGLATDQAAVAAHLAGGSAARALDKARDLSWQANRQAGFELFARAEGWDLLSILQWAEEQDKAKEKDQLIDLLKLWQSWYRDRLVKALGGSRNQLFNPDAPEQAISATLLTTADLQRNVQVIGDAIKSFEHNANCRLVLEKMLLGLRRKARG